MQGRKGGDKYLMLSLFLGGYDEERPRAKAYIRSFH